MAGRKFQLSDFYYGAALLKFLKANKDAQPSIVSADYDSPNHIEIMTNSTNDSMIYMKYATISSNNTSDILMDYHFSFTDSDLNKMQEAEEKGKKVAIFLICIDDRPKNKKGEVAIIYKSELDSLMNDKKSLTVRIRKGKRSLEILHKPNNYTINRNRILEKLSFPSSTKDSTPNLLKQSSVSSNEKSAPVVHGLCESEKSQDTEEIISSDLSNHYSLCDDFHGFKIERFMMHKIEYYVSDWRDFLKKICELLYEIDKIKFLSLLNNATFNQSRRNKMLYTQEEIDKLDVPSNRFRQVKDSNIFVYVLDNANGICRRVKKFLNEYKIAESDIIIFAKLNIKSNCPDHENVV